MPAADDLFRPTAVPDAPEERAGTDAVSQVDGQADSGAGVVALPTPPGRERAAGRSASGRVKHDEKITVYVTADELLDIEHARLELRRHGLAVDRGRLVRAAVALALAELDEHGTGSALVRRLSGD